MKFGDTDFNPAMLLGVLPEFIVVMTAVIVLATDLLSSRSANRRLLAWITAIGMLLAVAATFVVPPTGDVLFGDAQQGLGLLRNDGFARAFKIIFLVGGALTALVSAEFKVMRAGGESLTLLALSVLGLCLMAGSNDIIMLFLATETASIAGYLLSGFLRDSKRSSEAGLKYFVFGAVTSTIMLYGLSLLFGMTGETSYPRIAGALRASGAQYALVPGLSLAMVMVGFAFKTSIVPFHFWAPDVYEGAPTPISGFISTASKAAGFAIMIRFLLYIFPGSLTGTGEAAGMAGAQVWLQFVVPAAMVTMTLGNLMAALQKNVKRMLAYSSIAQAGYVMVGMAALAMAVSKTLGASNQVDFDSARGLIDESVASIIFYLATYMLTNIVAFAVVGLVIQKVGGEEIKLFSGLSKRAPYLALGMVAALLSLTGAPPLVGFLGKLFLFRAALAHPELLWLVVVAVVNVLISVFYYLGVVRSMYADKGTGALQPVYTPKLSGGVILVASIGLVLLTFAVSPFWDMALDAARSLLS